MSDTVLLVDRWQKVVAMNDAAEALLGWSDRDRAGLSCRLFNCQTPNGRYLCEEQCMVMRTLGDGLPIMSLPMMVKRSEGKPVQVELSILPIRAKKGGRYNEAAMVLKDRTRAVMYEDAIRDLTDELAQMSVVMRGVFKSLDSAGRVPVASIRGAVASLQEHVARQLGDSGVRQLKRIASATEDIQITTSRMQAQLRSVGQSSVGRSAGRRGER